MSQTTNPTTARFATQTGILPLRSLQLIGVAGPQDARRALLRTASGQIETVQVGDRIRQGTIVAIDDDAVILNTSSGSRPVRIPARPDPRVAA